jgi:hypothetical protein
VRSTRGWVRSTRGGFLRPGSQEFWNTRTGCILDARWMRTSQHTRSCDTGRLSMLAILPQTGALSESRFRQHCADGGTQMEALPRRKLSAGVPAASALPTRPRARRPLRAVELPRMGQGHGDLEARRGTVAGQFKAGRLTRMQPEGVQQTARPGSSGRWRCALSPCSESSCSPKFNQTQKDDTPAKKCVSFFFVIHDRHRQNTLSAFHPFTLRIFPCVDSFEFQKRGRANRSDQSGRADAAGGRPSIESREARAPAQPPDAKYVCHGALTACHSSPHAPAPVHRSVLCGACQGMTAHPVT